MKITATAVSLFLAAHSIVPVAAFFSIGGASFKSGPRPTLSVCPAPGSSHIHLSSSLFSSRDGDSSSPDDGKRRLVQTLTATQRTTLASEIARLESLVPKLAYVNRIAEASEARKRIVELRARDPYYMLEDEMTAALEAGDFDLCKKIRDEMRGIGGRPQPKSDSGEGPAAPGGASGSGGISRDMMKRMGGMGGMAAMMGMEEKKKPKPRWGPGSGLDIRGRPVGEGSGRAAPPPSRSKRSPPSDGPAAMGRPRTSEGRTLGKGWGPRQRPGVSNVPETEGFEKPAIPTPEKEEEDPELATTGGGSAAAPSLPARGRSQGDADLAAGSVGRVNPSSDVISNGVRVEVSSSYSPDRSDPSSRKHCFVYKVRITNVGNEDPVQLLGRRFEIQTVGSDRKDVVTGAGVTGRQPIIKRGETFEYTSTAPLSVRPSGDTRVAARMTGSYEFIVVTGADEKMQAEMGEFHFVLPDDL